MKPVMQTVLEAPHGNCFAACVASIFNLPLDEVPIEMTEGWFERFNEWLVAYGLVAIGLPMSPVEFSCGYTIRVARSARGDCLHAVVAKDGQLVHDPNPCSAGIVDHHEYIAFVVLDPSKAAKGPDRYSIGEATT